MCRSQTILQPRCQSLTTKESNLEEFLLQKQANKNGVVKAPRMVEFTCLMEVCSLGSIQVRGSFPRRSKIKENLPETRRNGLREVAIKCLRLRLSSKKLHLLKGTLPRESHPPLKRKRTMVLFLIVQVPSLGVATKRERTDSCTACSLRMFVIA